MWKDFAFYMKSWLFNNPLQFCRPPWANIPFSYHYKSGIGVLNAINLISEYGACPKNPIAISNYRILFYTASTQPYQLKCASYHEQKLATWFFNPFKCNKREDGRCMQEHHPSKHRLYKLSARTSSPITNLKFPIGRENLRLHLNPFSKAPPTHERKSM